MRDVLSKIIKPTGPSPTIGEAALHQYQQRNFGPIHRAIDFYNTAGRLHGLIVLVPLVYGVIQSERGAHLSLVFWGLALATVAFAIFGRRPPSVRLTPSGISFPENRSPEYPWDQMAEARAHASALDIVLSTGQTVQISYRKLRRTDVGRLKRLIRLQFQAMAEKVKEMQAVAA
jgi:hypothetical protein